MAVLYVCWWPCPIEGPHVSSQWYIASWLLAHDGTLYILGLGTSWQMAQYVCWIIFIYFKFLPSKGRHNNSLLFITRTYYRTTQKNHDPQTYTANSGESGCEFWHLTVHPDPWLLWHWGTFGRVVVKVNKYCRDGVVRVSTSLMDDSLR